MAFVGNPTISSCRKNPAPRFLPTSLTADSPKRTLALVSPPDTGLA